MVKTDSSDAQSEQKSFMELYNAKKIEFNAFQRAACEALGIKSAAFYGKIKSNSWKDTEKKLIAIWLEQDVEILFPEENNS